MKVWLTALLACCASAAPFTLVSSPNDIVSDKLEVYVTFDACVDSALTPDQLLFSSGVSVANGACVDMFDNQQYRCFYDVISAPNVFTVEVPANSVNADGGNMASQKLRLESAQELTVELATNPNTASLASEEVTFIGVFSHPVTTTNADVNSLFTVTVDGDEVSAKSVSFSEDGRTVSFTVESGIEKTVRATLKSGQFVDGAGQENSAATLERRTVTGLDCIQADPEVTRECSLPNGDSPARECIYYEFNGDEYAAVVATKATSRTVIQEPGPGGIPCDAVFEIESCYDNLCLPNGNDQLGPKPFAGEVPSQDCSNNCNPFKVKSASEPFTEANGCSCDQSCEAEGTCCQGYWSQNCCISGGDCTDELIHGGAYLGVSDADLSICTPNLCNSADPIQNSEIPSHYCFCDDQCVNDDTCCGGSAARNAVC